MATFFNEMDMVYCLCIQQRKQFVMDQINKLGIASKIKIIDAYTQENPIVQQIIANHYIYTIYTDNPITIACTLGIREIMLDIFQNKYNYAMVIEDDVIFLENMIEHGNKWITKKVIGNYFDIDKPYVLHLQCDKPENTFYHNKISAGGIIKTIIRYGEPAYITNYHACWLLLKHMFPITAAFDEYKFAIKCHYDIQQGILIPYICCELSANYSKYDTRELDRQFDHIFTRTLRNKTYSVWNIYSKSVFNIRTNQNNSCEKLLKFLIQNINPQLNLSFNDLTIPDNKMSYCIGTHEPTLKNNYIITGSFDANVKFGEQPTFIISVRGILSQNIIKNKFKFIPPIGDILLLYNKYIPKKSGTKYKYCFVYALALNIICTEPHICINSTDFDVDILLNAITSSRYVITDDINYVSIANSYAIAGIFAIINNTIEYNEIIAADYYSNITANPVKPLQIHCENNNITIDEKFHRIVEQFVQPVLPINYKIIENLVDTLPFVLNYHKLFRHHNKYVQIIN
jgi:GR25 family glycosyltransferase involved in LPS biosynthesis